MRRWRQFVGCLIIPVLSSCDFWDDKLEVKVARDGRGVAHVYSETLYGLYYGYGYSLAQDRLFQLDSTIRTIKGRAGEVFGARYLSTDKWVRRHTDFHSIKAQIDDLRRSEKQAFEMLDGFVAGLNDYIAWVQAKPDERLPAEYRHFEFDPPRQWTLEDVVLLYVGTMAYRYADFNYELDNLKFLRALEESHGIEKAWAIFNAVQPRHIPGSILTVPEGAASAPEQLPIRPAYLDRLAAIEPADKPLFAGDGGAVSDWNQPGVRQRAERDGAHGRLARESASNAWLLRASKLSDARAVLVNGPQFNFVNPAYVYGVALHGEDFRVFGNSLYGYPNLLFAHNGRIGWGSTAGFGDQVDIFQLEIHPEDPDRYYYGGRWHQLRRHPQRIAVRGQATVELDTDWTVIGPVVGRKKMEDGDVIYVRRRAWQGRSVESLALWLKLPLAQNKIEFLNYLKDFSLSINFFYLDLDGNIGYVHGGRYPMRAAEHDNRLPYWLGTSPESDWRGRLPFRQNPQIFNPETDYLVNWNNRPAAAWQNSDVWWVKWSLSDRAGVLQRGIEAKKQLSVDEAWKLIENSSYQDLNFPHLRFDLLDALDNIDDNLATELARLLRAWDGRWQDRDVDGWYDSPANAWMQLWLPVLFDVVFADDIPSDQLDRFLATGYPVKDTGPITADALGVSIISRLMARGSKGVVYDFFNDASPARLISSSVERALAAARESYGDDPSDWRIANPGWRFPAVNFRGVPTGVDPLTGPQAPMNRGSENNIFVAREGKLVGYDVVPPSQNAYRADQMDAFLTFENYPLGEDKQISDFERVTTFTIEPAEPPRDRSD